MSQFGTALVLVGLALVGYSGLAYFGLVPGGYTVVPAPAALSSGQRAVRREPDAYPTVEIQPSVADLWVRPTPTRAAGPARPTAVAINPGVALKLEPADAQDRIDALGRPRPGTPVRLRIPAIDVDTDVKEGGVIKDANGQYQWETLPFVATTYAFLGPVGRVGNPVISGHVVTISMGNVFRNLFKVELGQPIEVYTQNSMFVYVVDEIKLVPPTAIEVVQPTEDARLTVITCGGRFDPNSRSFSDRLIVVGKLAAAERL